MEEPPVGAVALETEEQLDRRLDETRKRYELEKLSQLQREIDRLRNRKKLVPSMSQKRQSEREMEISLDS